MGAPKTVATNCPCGSGLDYRDCCQPCHDGEPAPTAEALMRSRYSAYVKRLAPYLLATWDTPTRPPALDLDDDTRWLGLEVKRHAPTGDDAAIVEFVARYKLGGRAFRLHEISRFVRRDGRWYYVDGQFPEPDGRQKKS